MNTCNVPNRTIFRDDNLEVLRGFNSECIDLIYLDPPFNKNKEFSASIGTSAEGASFRDIFREDDVKSEWLLTIEEDEPQLFQFLTGVKHVGKPYNFAYLSYMAIRLLECHRVLKPCGSIYLHCDSTMSHYLKVVMDSIFGEEKFRNEIIWKRNPSHEDSSTFGNVSETLLFYGADIHKDAVRIALDEETKAHYKYSDRRGRYRPENLKSGGLRGGGYSYDFHGHSGPWRCPETTMIQYERDNLIHFPKKKDGVPQRKRYLEDHPGLVPTNIWLDIKKARGKEYVGYPTQKPKKLLERIIKASTAENDMVLDPICGCATTLVAAQSLSRQWIGIDISVKAYEIVQERLKQEKIDRDDLMNLLGYIQFKTDAPHRTDLGAAIQTVKYVYVISHPRYPGEYKVGIAKNWKSRLSSFQTSDPDSQFQLEFKLETPWYREIERHVHAAFDSKHEWVTGDLGEIVETIQSFSPVLDSAKTPLNAR